MHKTKQNLEIKRFAKPNHVTGEAFLQALGSESVRYKLCYSVSRAVGWPESPPMTGRSLTRGLSRPPHSYKTFHFNILFLFLFST